MSADVATEEIAVSRDTNLDDAMIERIRVRAYEIHVAGTGGDPVTDWVLAEQELLGELGNSEASDSTPEAVQG